MTDIVERLHFGSLTHEGASQLNLEAADEIDRLRTELAERDKIIAGLQDAIDYARGDGDRYYEKAQAITSAANLPKTSPVILVQELNKWIAQALRDADMDGYKRGYNEGRAKERERCARIASDNNNSGEGGIIAKAIREKKND